jgi:hypothetical protein
MWGHDVAALLERHLGIKVTVPPQMTLSPDKPITRMFKVEYIGASKLRDDGSQTSTGWTNNGWNLILPLATMQKWFGKEQRPDEVPTLYTVLGIKKAATEQEIKKAYRLAARTWHPDVNQDPGASQQFIRIQAAYEILSNPSQRKKYNAALKYERDSNSRSGTRKPKFEPDTWQPPLRCGYISVVGMESLGRFTVQEVLGWLEITNEQGQSMVSYWPAGATQFKTEWI